MPDLKPERTLNFPLTKDSISFKAEMYRRLNTTGKPVPLGITWDESWVAWWAEKWDESPDDMVVNMVMNNAVDTIVKSVDDVINHRNCRAVAFLADAMPITDEVQKLINEFDALSDEETFDRVDEFTERYHVMVDTYRMRGG